MKKNYPNNVFEEALVLYGITLSEADYKMASELSEIELSENQLKNLEYLVSLNTVEYIKVFNLRFKDKKSYYNISSSYLFKNMSDSYASKIVKDMLFKMMNHTSLSFIYSDNKKDIEEFKKVYGNNLNLLNLTNKPLSALLMAGINNIDSLKKLIENKGLDGLCCIKNIGEQNAKKIIETMYTNGYLDFNPMYINYKDKPVLTKETKISDAGFSRRIHNALSRYGVTNIGELVTIVNDNRIYHIPNIGEISIKEITEFLIENNFIKPKRIVSEIYNKSLVYQRSELVMKIYEDNMIKMSNTHVPYPINLIQLLGNSLLIKLNEELINDNEGRKGYGIIKRTLSMVSTLTPIEQDTIRYFLKCDLTKDKLYAKHGINTDYNYVYQMAIRKLKHPYRFRIISGEIDIADAKNTHYFSDIKYIDIADLDVDYINGLYPNLFDKIDKAIPNCTMKQFRDIIEVSPKYWYEKDEFYDLSRYCEHKIFIKKNILFIKYLINIGLVREVKIKDKIHLKSI